MTDADTAAAFDALGDETRVAILQALVEHRRENPQSPALSFSALRKHVGASDSGRFNYHLGKLRDRFVEKSEDGYALTFAGEQMATAVLSGAVADDAELGPEPLEDDCSFCGAALHASYEDGYISVECEADHGILQIPAAPTLVRDRDIETVLAVAVQNAYDDIALAKRGVCGSCYGHMESTLREREYEGRTVYGFEAVCSRCGERYSSTVALTLFDHPEFVAFLAAHDRDLDEQYPWQFDFVSPQFSPDVLSEDPFRVRVTVELDGDEFVAIVDDSAHVIETES
ncbi:winged helix-turn-helix domain-containing protein [Halobacterium zhouii]|uniref:winged helix-turn-helix domain-containing protein n=1 Tax=Halobacterium zhouii TaxID=2902624 RepID=UPI001E56F899|nr:winged helix-turn-helix domain-containing protein [Halobacterium zhouii]